MLQLFANASLFYLNCSSQFGEPVSYTHLSVKEFRELVGEIAGLMCYEATRNLPTREVEDVYKRQPTARP